MERRRTKVALLLVAGLMTGCGSDNEGPTRAELVDALTDGGVEPVEARCWVGEIYEHLSPDDRRAVERADEDYSDFDDPERVQAANRKCL